MRFISTLVTQGSGVVGNLVVEKNGIIRNRNVPSNPNTAAQALVRAVLASLSTRWRDTLTQLQRDGWNAYAATVVRNDALGKPVKLSGIDTFVAGNAADQTVVAGPFDDAPTSTGGLTLPAATSVVIDDSANTVVVTFAASIPTTTYVNLQLSTSAVSAGRSTYSGPFRFHQTVHGVPSVTITFTGVTLPVAGQKFGWRLSAFDAQGRVSKDQIGLSTVVA